MKKRNVIILILLSVLIIGIGMVVIYSYQPNSQFKDVTIMESELPEEEKEDLEKEEEEQTEQESASETEQKPLSEIVVNVVESTLEFFSLRETHVTAIGDSLTQGVGATNEQGGYVGILDRSINKEEDLVAIDNLGIRGNRSDQLLSRLEDPEVVDSIHQSDIVLITIGANDIMQVVKENFTNLKMEDFDEARDSYEDRLRKIFSKIHDISPKSQIYLLGFYDPFSKYFREIKELSVIVEEWNGTSRKVTEELDNTMYIPTRDLFEGSEADLFSEDNFHPNDKGYKRIAKRVLEYLTSEEG
ncbi:SGNH/GDSL hydrolase family protein [Oceanobacillus jordanicus]|uniref:SGNH/GDSL hydrolase family protein n=1 Tax=Oceanobacillus jordanicus TaxID=2867266 RepID=A0AAW5B2D5_9BACI|nr:SGNH/GDSL hydrolase family protein [Oceanobacillus jordanicus]MCG3417855.1 SGNH/GDSL hydrolase family protein [Oceanobacillus jordanicus]